MEGLLASIAIGYKVLASYQNDELGHNVDIVYGSCPRMVESKTLPGGRTYGYQYNSAKQ